MKSIHLFTTLGIALALTATLSAPRALAQSDAAADGAITAEVAAILAKEPMLRAEPVDILVRTVDQVTYLRGVVDTELQRRTAGILARKAPDAKKVINEIEVGNL